MKIEKDVVYFKSATKMFRKECIGIKPNTVRVLTLQECTTVFDKTPTKIHISEVGTKRNFVRDIEDISHFSPKTVPNHTIVIFSWFTWR